MSVGSKIKSYLDENGIKQYCLAQRIGISESKLNLTLNEKRRMKFEEYELICFVLGVGVDKFIQPRNPSQTKGSV